jgi:gliding motility-associated-like protein
MKLYLTLFSCMCFLSTVAQDCDDFNLSLPEEIVLCEPGPTTLTANITGVFDEVQWSPLTGLLNPTATSTTAEITGDITYTIAARRVSDTELIRNGDFSQGDTGFTSDYIYGTGGGVGLLSNEGQYAIDDNAGDTHNRFANCRDRSGGGNIMVVNASGDPTSVWCQTVTIQPNTSYLFSAWVTSVVSQNPAQLQFAVNGSLLGSPYNATPVTCSWQNFSAEWQSAGATSAEICISNTNFTPAGNDFALDDISLREICEATASVTVRIPQLVPDFDLPNEICSNTPMLDPGDFLLPTSTTGGSWLLDGAPLTTLTPSSLPAGPHRLEYRVQDGTCQAMAARDFSIVAAPEAGSAAGPDRSCFLADETLLLGDLLTGADPGGSWSLQSGPESASLDPNNGELTLTQAGNYTVAYRVSGSAVCSPDSVVLTIERTPPPAAELPASVVLDCDMPDAILGSSTTSSGPGINYRWLRNGEPYPGNGPTLVVDIEGTFTLEVTDANGCQDRASTIVSDQVVELTIDAVVVPAPCDNPTGGAIQVVEISGGTEPYLTSLNDSPFRMVDRYPELAAGNYELRAQDAGGCEGSFTLQLIAPVQPTLMLSTDQDEPLNLGESISLRVLSSIPPTNLDTLIWVPDLPDSLRTGPFQWRLTPLETTNYQLTAIDQNGCKAQANVLIPVVTDGRVFVPNAISPNEDGRNDRFVIYDGGAVARIIELQVFNRWGAQVYQSANLSTNSESGAWDGTQAGQRLPAGVYIYSLRVEWINGTESQLSGEIQLVY